ncbi:MAG: Y-family DNA polymerase [Bacteroidetes bacterium]|mgnify:CR=1 FL=1|jgi:DNA polymerase V|nr:Y-family DNA polymerase [Bacteroidota bacterium]MDA1018808.1 Y-family DNA polymerase [Bacteroidota bacterium]|tara:strand:+ start:9038 stop:10297 length:1260 start_codon:yes stop_codon:yes gene_type:complete
MFALVDCNNFYASCERVFNPKLNKKPIVILSNNDGCVISRSNEAKALGIPMGAPAFKYNPLFKKNKVHVFSSNFPLYGDMSSRVMSILSTYTPNIEIYSIDEAFLELKGFENYDLEEYGKEIRKKILKWTGIPVSVGIAQTKALAKVANRISKKFDKKTKGVYVISSEEKRIKALKWLKIEDVWGIGYKHSERLKNHNINKAYDFIKLPDNWVRKQMSVVGLRLKKELEGESVLSLEENRSPKKAIATTRSFEKNLTCFEDLKERISTFSICCSEKLRSQKSSCNSIYVFIKSNRNQKNKSQYQNGLVMTLPYGSNSSITISKYAVEGLRKIYKKGIEYKKAGVIVLGLIPNRRLQLNIFEKENPKHEVLMKTLDFITKKEGPNKIKLASQDLKRVWKMKQTKLSSRYTTELNEIISLK